MENIENCGYADLITTKYKIFPCYKTIVLDEILSSDWDFVVLGNPVEKLFSRINLIEYLLSTESKSAKLSLLNCDLKFINIIISELEDISLLNDKQCDAAIIISSQGEILGILDRYRELQYHIVETKRKLWQKDLRIDFYKQILDVMEDDVFITDEYGFIQYINPSGEQVCQIKLDNYIGRHVTDLEKDGIVSQSITMQVLQSREREERAVKLSSGRLIMAIGIPVYNKENQLKYVFSTSKDVREISGLLEKIAGMIQEIDVQKRELEILRDRMASQKEYVFESAPMKHVQKIIAKVAPTDATVLIEGESGTGKEVVADMIHQCSDRHIQPFVKINCELIPENLLESELFGYEPGAFTGADKKGKVGKIETANMGTVFFDEIGEMPLSLQVKLLDFLQNRSFTRVGGTKKIPIDVRVVAATNRNLHKMVDEGTFRNDLYYRLNVMPLKLMPLHERQEDILPLTTMFLNRYNMRYHKNRHLDSPVIDELHKYSWPGNVRELMHTIERLIITAENDIITVDDLMEVLYSDSLISGNIICNGILPLKEARIELETILVKGAYEKLGTTYKAAEALGINQSTVVRILKRLKTNG
ncbi:MAG: sigma 54-interacting transcriptional regulator [Clostridiales bacterium]